MIKTAANYDTDYHEKFNSSICESYFVTILCREIFLNDFEAVDK